MEACDEPGIETVYSTALKAAEALCPIVEGRRRHRGSESYDAAYKAFQSVADSCVVKSSEADPDIKKLAKTIHPVVRRADKLFYIKKVDLFGVAFTWDPKVTEEAVGLKAIGHIKTLHRCGYYGMFKPSIAEVLCQIPPALQDRGVVAFEVEGPETAADLNEELVALDAGFQVAVTTLYIKPL